MEAAWVYLGVVVTSAIIQRARSSAGVRWQLRYAWALVLTLGQAVVSVIAVSSRGLSKSSIGLVAVTAVLLGAGLLILVDVRSDAPTDETSRKLYIAWPPFRVPNGPVAMRRLSHTLLVTTAVMALWALVPLRYAGKLDSLLGAIAVVESAGHFAPLREVLPIAAGQCIEDNYRPEARNTVVPCSHPHASEVVKAIYPAHACPDRSVYGQEGLSLDIVPVGGSDAGYRGLVFCVAR